MEIENKFEFRGNNFRMAKWLVTNINEEEEGIVPEEKGIVQIIKDNGECVDIIEYNGFNLDKRYSEEYLSWNESGKTEQYSKNDNFNFDKKHVIAFMERHNREMTKTFEDVFKDINVSEVLAEMEKDNAKEYFKGYYLDKVKETLKEKGFPSYVKPNDVKYIVDVKSKGSKDDWLKAMHDGLNKGRLPKSATLREIIAYTVEYYPHYYDIQVDILSDVESFN